MWNMTKGNTQFFLVISRSDRYT